LNSQIKKTINDHDYLGWIPCVIGRLDFSKVRIDQLPCVNDTPQRASICFSYTDRHSLPTTDFNPRFNVVSSVQNWKDRPDVEGAYDGHFRFITISKTSKNGSMNGVAFLLLDSDVLKHGSFVTDVLAPLTALEEKIKEYKNAIAADQYQPTLELDIQRVEKEIDRIETMIIQFCNQELKDRIIMIQYSILSNGLFFVKPVMREDLYDDVEIRKAVTHSNFIAAKQCFIYIKYSLHTHKHHAVAEDRLTSIHPINKEKIEETGLRLINDMECSIIEIKEMGVNKMDASQHYMLGFISYSKSLIQSLVEVNIIEPTEGTNRIEFFNNMLQSWRSLILRHDSNAKELAYKKSKDADAITYKESKDVDAIGEFFQSLSLLVTVFALFFSGIRWYIPKDNSFEDMYGTQYEFLSVFFDNPIRTFIVLGISVLTLISLRIITNPHGVIRRPLKYIWNKTTIKGLVNLIRGLLVVVFIFTLGSLLGN
jgi:hypothetical protein